MLLQVRDLHRKPTRGFGIQLDYREAGTPAKAAGSAPDQAMKSRYEAGPDHRGGWNSDKIRQQAFGEPKGSTSEDPAMKNRGWMALLLALALAVPALAQQSSTDQAQSNSGASTQAAPAAQTDQSTQAPATQTDQSTQAPASATQTTGQASTAQSGTAQTGARQPLAVDKKQGFWGKLNPFARKKYVQKQLSPVRDRVNELDELTAENSKNIKDVDSRAQEGIRLASAKANEADQHATDAGNRAQQANQTAQQATTRITTVENVVSNIDQYKPNTQTEIRFRAGQNVLSKRAKEALDQMAEPLKNQRGYIIEVQGFSSGRGQTAIANSQRMAESVVRYLVLNHDVPVYRIYLLGMGNAPVQANTQNGTKAKRTSGGRVEVSLLKNDLEQLSANGGNAAPANAPAQTQQPEQPQQK
jgi:outer membrane protein OmpA-like peptidoglycan-associated protein